MVPQSKGFGVDQTIKQIKLNKGTLSFTLLQSAKCCPVVCSACQVLSAFRGRVDFLALPEHCPNRGDSFKPTVKV